MFYINISYVKRKEIAPAPAALLYHAQCRAHVIKFREKHVYQYMPMLGGTILLWQAIW